MNTTNACVRSPVPTIGLCFIVALFEGLDVQSAGIAGPAIAAHFGLSPSMMGAVFSASIIGLLPGALVGGWLADRLGRKRVLIVAVIIFGMFSLATAMAWSFESLLMMRFLTGVGLGAAMPNLIALASEAVEQRSHGQAVSIMYCGLPLGGAIAVLISNADLEDSWKAVFYVGGVGPLLVVPLLCLWLPESAVYHAQKERDHCARRPYLRVLFQQGAARSTLLLWVSYFFTLMVLYLLQNWLPSLMMSQGLVRSDAGTVQVALNLGGAIGSLLMGLLMDRWRVTALIVSMYLGTVAALAGLGFSSQFYSMVIAAFAAGFFSIGSQLVLYALAPRFYPTGIRGTGVGSALAVGRLGSMSGPLVAGQMLAAGSGGAMVLMAATPGIVVAAAAMLFLVAGQHRKWR
ncbi:3-(3-hydroxy-phenyl)propionate transporter MhpT [Pseudomonas sp. L13]|uniref:3-(3-hydroxy-phenyl)propionate transporter MhpT n=1 Tax=Pseudomonas sp. L13 TaxID=343985 RepID=UPI0013795337|nr:3-(3-hydroxy-phenyl)propionate transporter MhpT [Pseudomonas sp. L13]NCE89378.1 3-(3-hydroxy-phenyl)propionate transporter MhpT [Pseudomonas sp. L13]